MEQNRKEHGIKPLVNLSNLEGTQRTEKNRAGSRREKADGGTADGGTEQWRDALVVVVAATKLQCQLPAPVRRCRLQGEGEKDS
ncbi:hypothetical protein AHAS_Ahas05G0060400 [Arachis hypogaea]